MAGAFSQVDLSQLSPPNAVEPLDFEAILTAMLADLIARDPSFSALVESDPAMKILEVAAYRELLIRQRVNDAVRAVMPAYATGADLDHLAALFGVTRLAIIPADPVAGTPAVMEGDEDMRRRMVLAPEGFSVAGPEGAYTFHALTADGEVLDASVSSPAPGEVVVAVLSRVGDGEASPELVATVESFLTDSERRPLTDFVTVKSAEIVDYLIDAEIWTFAGPDSAVVMAAAAGRLAEYVDDCHRLARDVALSGIHAALHVPGVQRVEITAPAADIVIAWDQAPYCTGSTVTHAGTAE